jgi:hypothetical protein
VPALTALLALVAMASATTYAIRHPTFRSAGLLLAAAVPWLLLNGPFEGPTLVVVSPGHGLTVADLLVPGALLLAAIAAVGRRRRSRTQPKRPEM